MIERTGPNAAHRRAHPFVLGVIMLDTNFPRLERDIGNPASFPFATLYRRVPAATVATVVTDDELPPEVAQAILAAAEDLQAQGVSLIATSCGFLGALDRELRGRLRVPVISSALVLIPFLRAIHGPRARIGVLTFDSRRLAPAHFGGHHDERIAIEGIETGEELHRVIAGDLPSLDVERARGDAVAAAGRLMRKAPDTAAILLECTNLAPYRAEIAATSGRPVYDITQAILWQAGAALEQDRVRSNRSNS